MPLLEQSYMKDKKPKKGTGAAANKCLEKFVPVPLRNLQNPQSNLPRIAKDPDSMSAIEDAVQTIPTNHTIWQGDTRCQNVLAPDSIQLVLTSPPYWTLKQYPEREGQLGNRYQYEAFLEGLNQVWQLCYDALTPGGRLICVVGDVCLSRRKNNGRHMVVPLHADIQSSCRNIGFDNLAPLIWHKIGNASYEANTSSRFFGKPYEPNAVVKNDIEFILMQRKPGGYRSPEINTRILSLISHTNHHEWFRQIWTGLNGASTKEHPAPYPLALAERLIRMFSFAGDTVLDPFSGSGTTSIAAAKWGRNSVAFEIDPDYVDNAHQRLTQATTGFAGCASIRREELQPLHNDV